MVQNIFKCLKWEILATIYIASNQESQDSSFLKRCLGANIENVELIDEYYGNKHDFVPQ